jgi:hypothetical protein
MVLEVVTEVVAGDQREPLGKFIGARAVVIGEGPITVRAVSAEVKELKGTQDRWQRPEKQNALYRHEKIESDEKSGLPQPLLEVDVVEHEMNIPGPETTIFPVMKIRISQRGARVGVVLVMLL